MKRTVVHTFLWDYALCMTVYHVGVGTLMAKLTAWYGLSIPVSNLVLGMPSTLMFLELLGGYFYSCSKQPHRYIKLVSTGWRVCFPLVLLAVLLPIKAAIYTTVLLYGSMCLFYRLAMPAYNAWTVAQVAKCDSPNFYSKRDFFFMVLYTVALFFSGMLIDSAEQAGQTQSGFLWVAGAEIVLVAFSLICLHRAPGPAGVRSETKLSFFVCLLRPLQDKNYGKVLRMHMAWNFCAAFVGGFAAVYQVQVLTVSYFQIVFWGMAANLVRILLIPVFSKLSQKIGWNRSTLITMAIMAVSYIAWAGLDAANQTWLFPTVTILGAVPWAALGIGLFQYQIIYTTEENRSTYFSVSSALSGFSAAAGTAVCSAVTAWLANWFAVPPYGVIFLAGAGGVLATMLLVKSTPYRNP